MSEGRTFYFDFGGTSLYLDPIDPARAESREPRAAPARPRPPPQLFSSNTLQSYIPPINHHPTLWHCSSAIDLSMSLQAESQNLPSELALGVVCLIWSFDLIKPILVQNTSPIGIKPTMLTLGTQTAATFASAAYLCILALIPIVNSASCSPEEEPTFSCPNCGGIDVSDCSQCDGYLFTDQKRGVCYDRSLFSYEGEENFLWVDMWVILWCACCCSANYCWVRCMYILNCRV